MKKFAEVVDQPSTGELERRISALEARIEKLSPSPSLESREPYPIGSDVYSVVDLGARYPMTVMGYRNGRILVVCSPGEPERALSLDSVVSLSKCPNATPSPAQIFSNIADPKARAFFEGRLAAQTAAKVTPPLPPPPKQRRWFGEQDEIPTWGISGPAVGTGESR